MEFETDQMKNTLYAEQLAHRLGERVKELNCLYAISSLSENQKLNLNEILLGVIECIPPAWQYPECTCARIRLKNMAMVTQNFKETIWSQKQKIVVFGKNHGSIEIFYLEQKPESDEGPFLKEERNLIRVIAERLGNTIERKFAEENLKISYQHEKELRQKLQAEAKIRVDFTRKLIHELKTPLTSLIATSQLLLDETRDNKYGKLAGYICESAESLNKRIDELHDVIRGEIGTLELSLKPLNIETLLRSLLEGASALFEQNGIDLDLEIDKKLPIIYADDDRIKQVMLNLINNALKYASAGKYLLIRASVEGATIKIQVKDSGPGIPEKYQKTLFEPGYQILQQDKRSGGLGIGLSLCRTLVELHGGDIWLKSKPGKGSSFYFTLPIRQINQTESNTITNESSNH